MHFTRKPKIHQPIKSYDTSPSGSRLEDWKSQVRGKSAAAWRLTRTDAAAGGPTVLTTQETCQTPSEWFISDSSRSFSQHTSIWNACGSKLLETQNGWLDFQTWFQFRGPWLLRKFVRHSQSSLHQFTLFQLQFFSLIFLVLIICFLNSCTLFRDFFFTDLSRRALRWSCNHACRSCCTSPGGQCWWDFRRPSLGGHWMPFEWTRLKRSAIWLKCLLGSRLVGCFRSELIFVCFLKSYGWSRFSL